jgi:hypothetical protein
MRSVLASNTYMPYVLTPIISTSYNGSLASHEIMFNKAKKNSTKISCYVKRREDEDVVKPRLAKEIEAGYSFLCYSVCFKS